MRTRVFLTCVVVLGLVLASVLLMGCSKGEYVGSTITMTYHHKSCAWAEQLEGTDRAVWFETAEEAEAAGYHPCSTCCGEE